jgi:hypothetical protein
MSGRDPPLLAPKVEGRKAESFFALLTVQKIIGFVANFVGLPHSLWLVTL